MDSERSEIIMGNSDDAIDQVSHAQSTSDRIDSWSGEFWRSRAGKRDYTLFTLTFIEP
jgi:hypothetical protein